MADEKFEKGRQLTNQMFGKELSDRLIESATDFSKPVMEYAMNVCFGDVWQRPGLDPKTRSMLTLAMLTALGQQNQIKVHIRGAIGNGVSREEIREILVHSIVYCGLPRAVDAFASAGEVLKELDQE